MRGLTKVLKAIADAAGWEWCEEHESMRYDGVAPCNLFHPVPAPDTSDWYYDALRLEEDGW